MAIKHARGDRAFDRMNTVFMILICVITLYPFIYILSLSFGGSVTMGLSLIPKDITLAGYQRAFDNANMLSGFFNSVLRTLFGTFMGMVVTTSGAYALSKRRFPNRGFWTSICVFTMFFSGGMIPTYLLVSNLGLLDSMFAMILPGLVSVYNMTIMRNFFMAVPDSMEESAMLDGANDIVILFRIILPVSTAILATVGLWTAVGHWNAWFDCMIYIRTTSKQVLQLIMRRIVIEGTTQVMDLTATYTDYSYASPDTVKGAVIVVTTLPILIVYPFLQKYFVKGVMIGSLKG